MKVITTPFSAGRANGNDEMIWVSQANYSYLGGDGHTQSIARIDPRTNKVVAVVARIPVTLGTGIPTFGAGSVWVGGESSTTIDQVDPATNRVVRSIKVPDFTTELGAIVADDSLWVSGYETATLYRFTLR